MKIRNIFKSLFLLIGLFGFSSDPVSNNIKKTTISITPSLRMAKAEVNNYEYRQFIKALKTSGNQELAKKYYPDTTVWMKQPYTMGDPMMVYYYSHPAFSNYPVVGITQEAAIAYCEWMTEETQKGLKDTGYNLKYRLPTKAEWETAAKLNTQNVVYAGGWTKVKRNVIRKKEPNGYYFNHRIAEDNFAEDGYSYSGPVGRDQIQGEEKQWRSKSSLKADKNGFYHLAGNVAEMVAKKGISVGGSFNDYEDKARIGVTNTYTAPNAWTGFRYIVEYTKTDSK